MNIVHKKPDTALYSKLQFKTANTKIKHSCIIMNIVTQETVQSITNNNSLLCEKYTTTIGSLISLLVQGGCGLQSIEYMPQQLTDWCLSYQILNLNQIFVALLFIFSLTISRTNTKVCSFIS